MRQNTINHLIRAGANFTGGSAINRFINDFRNSLRHFRNNGFNRVKMIAIQALNRLIHRLHGMSESVGGVLVGHGRVIRSGKRHRAQKIP